jgi:hypothetical protein
MVVEHIPQKVLDEGNHFRLCLFQSVFSCVKGVAWMEAADEEDHRRSAARKSQTEQGFTTGARCALCLPETSNAGGEKVVFADEIHVIDALTVSTGWSRMWRHRTAKGRHGAGAWGA